MEYTIPDNKLEELLCNLACVQKITDVHKFRSDFITQYRMMQCDIAAEKGDIEALYESSKFLYERSYNDSTVENAIKHGFMDWLDQIKFLEYYMEYVMKYHRIEWFKERGLEIIQRENFNQDQILFWVIQHKHLDLVAFLINEKGWKLHSPNIRDSILTGDIPFVKDLLLLIGKNLTDEINFSLALCNAARTAKKDVCEWVYNQYDYSSAEIPEDFDAFSIYYEALLRGCNVDLLQFFFHVTHVQFDTMHLEYAIKHNTPEVAKYVAENVRNIPSDNLAFVAGMGMYRDTSSSWICQEYEEMVKLMLTREIHFDIHVYEKVISAAFASNNPKIFTMIVSDPRWKTELDLSKLTKLLVTNDEFRAPTVEMLELLSKFDLHMKKYASKIAQTTFSFFYTDTPEQKLDELRKTIDWCCKYLSSSELEEMFELNTYFQFEVIAANLEKFSIPTREKLFQMLDESIVDEYEDSIYEGMIAQMERILTIHKRVKKTLYEEPIRALVAKTVVEEVICKYI